MVSPLRERAYRTIFSLSPNLPYMRKNRLLMPRHRGTLSWFMRRLSERLDRGNIGFVVFGDHETGRAHNIVLEFHSRSDGGEWQEIRQDVLIEWTACNYGGGRPWFRCPSATGAALFCIQALLSSSAGSAAASPTRRRTRTRKTDCSLRPSTLRERLGQTEGGIVAPFPPKPKGMHWDTYCRLKWKGICLENIQWKAAAERFGLDTFTRNVQPETP
jgi:hypothetical protein